jgi:large subunit ribosomal protein L14
MLRRQSRIVITDNTGAKEAEIIGTLGSAYRKRTLQVGDVAVVAIKVSTPDATVPKSSKVKVVIVRTKAPIRRLDGSYVRFSDNAGVIINPADNNPKGTRIFGPVARELRQKNFMKIISLAPAVL